MWVSVFTPDAFVPCKGLQYLILWLELVKFWSDLSETDAWPNILGFKKGRQYATTWVEKAENWNEYYGGSRKYTKIDCYLETQP